MYVKFQLQLSQTQPSSQIDKSLLWISLLQKQKVITNVLPFKRETLNSKVGVFCVNE